MSILGKSFQDAYTYIPNIHPCFFFLQDVVAVKEAYEDVWTGLDVSEQEQIINESIIRPDAILRYEGHVAIRDSARHPSANTAEVRLSSFGVDKVFPRFKVQSGQKENTFEDTSGSQGEDLGSDCVSTLCPRADWFL